MLSLRHLLRTMLMGATLAGCGSVVVVAPPGSDVPPTSDVPPASDVPPTSDLVPIVDAPRTCSSTADCNRGEECGIREGCGVPSYCGPALGRPCTGDSVPYCGCDGTTFYASSICPTRTYSFRGACSDPPPMRVCRFPDGRTCAQGQRCPAPDGCNTCTCSSDGSLSCTEIACPDAGPGACTLSDGRTCRVGETCRAPDGCNTCICRPGGMLSCTLIGCVDAGPRVDVTPVVGCNTEADCPAGTTCFGAEGCGVRWRCVARACTDDIAAYCGCDGTSFGASSTCPGRPYQHRGRCSMAPPPVDGGGVPTDAGVAPACAPQDARGEGLCAAFFGYAWNGSTCVGLSGCRCVGSACGSLPLNPADCARRYRACM